jgi:hypothetical protein
MLTPLASTWLLATPVPLHVSLAAAHRGCSRRGLALFATHRKEGFKQPFLRGRI